MPHWMQTAIVLSACSASIFYLLRRIFKKKSTKGCSTCSRCGGCGNQ